MRDEGKLPARLRINFLHQDTTADLPTLAERLKHSFKFFGDDMVRTGGIGEFIAGAGPTSPFAEAARLVARAGWRAEVHSLSATDFQQEIAAYETAHTEFPISDLRWVVAHVPLGPGRPERRLLHRAGREAEEDPIGAYRAGRQDHS